MVDLPTARVHCAMLVVVSGLPGVGKTTVARALARATGAVHIRVDSIEQALRNAGHRVEAEGYAVAHAVAEDNLRLGGLFRGRGGRDGLDGVFDRFPVLRERRALAAGTLSGGERQMLVIGRALLAKPSIIVADEPTSALDVSVQAEIVALLRETVAEHSVSMLFISHDLALVQALCQSIYVLKDGLVEDRGDPDFIFSRSQNPYTRSLIDARSARFSH